MKRKKIEAWAAVDADGFQDAWLLRKDAEDMALAWERDGYGTQRVVRLVEHDPRKDAVVRAALNYIDGDATDARFEALVEAVERYRKPTARRRAARDWLEGK